VRVIYLHQYFNTHTGGTRSYEMARRLAAKGYDIQLVTSDRNGGRPRTGRGWYQTREAGIDVHWLPVPYSNRMGHWARIRAFARFALFASHKAASLGGDVVFATSTPLTIAAPAVYAARRNRIPMVFEVRDLWPTVPIAVGALRTAPAIAAARWLERFAYRHAARVVALSPGIKEGVLATGYPEDRVSVIPNACDFDIFDVGPVAGRELRRHHRWLGQRPLVVYAGTLGAVNGVSYLARLAAESAQLDADVCFVVVGDGKEEATVRRTADELGVLNRNFFLLPSVPKHTVAEWLSAADLATSLFIDLPELRANSANKVFDALAAGRPVAINYEGWQAELFRETGAGFVLDPRDYRAAAGRLIAAVRNSQWLARAGAAARRLARTQFDRDTLTAQLERVLRAAVEAPTPRAGSDDPAVARTECRDCGSSVTAATIVRKRR
jgi:glycosyltransferase involved in cell wall biosynthesis